MWSHILVFLAICHGLVSTAKVEVYVKGVTEGYKTLEFRGTGNNKKSFAIGTQTGAGTVEVRDNKIAEEELTVDFTPTFAVILPVCAYPKTDLKLETQGACSSNCFKNTQKDTYYLHVSGIHKTQTEMTCTAETGDAGGKKEFTLKHAGAAGTAATPKEELSVKDGAITETLLKFEFTPKQCVISVPQSDPPAKTRNNFKDADPADKTITLSPDACPAKGNCFLKNAATVEVHASKVDESQDKITFTKTTDKKTFTLVVGGTTGGSIINVENGAISEKEVPLPFDPEACEIEAVIAKELIPIVESAKCTANTANCFKNEDSTTTSFATSNKFSKMILPVVYLIIGKMW